MRDNIKRILIAILSGASMLAVCIVFGFIGWGDGDSAMERIVGIVAIISGMGSLLVGVSSIFTTSLDNVREYFATGEKAEIADARHVLYNYRNLKIKYGKTVYSEGFDEWVAENLDKEKDKNFYVENKAQVLKASSRVLNFYQMWGLLQYRNFLPIWVFDTTSGYNMIRLYEATIDIIKEKRKSNRLYAGHFEDLCKRVNKKYNDVIEACRADNRDELINDYGIENPDASPYFNIEIKGVVMPSKKELRQKKKESMRTKKSK